jgi:hypothetical protein
VEGLRLRLPVTPAIVSLAMALLPSGGQRSSTVVSQEPIRQRRLSQERPHRVLLLDDDDDNDDDLDGILLPLPRRAPR